MIDVKYRHMDGRIERVRELARTRRGAERREREIINAMELGTWKQPREEVIEQKKPLTLNDFADEFIETYAKVNNKPSEITSKEGILRRYLKPSLGSLNLEQIKVRQIETLKAALLSRPLSPKTVNNVLVVLGKVLRYAEEIEILDTVPRIRMLRAPKPDFDFLTFDETDRLLEAAEVNPECYGMIFFALRTGVRYGELCELRWFDIDLRNGRVVVRRSYYLGEVTAPKGGKAREIPLSPQLVELLQRRRHLKSELVFCKDSGSWHRYFESHNALKSVCRLANLRPIGWHVLRHTFASHLAMKGVPLKTIQELLGHATIEMTMRYAHLSPEVKRDAVILLDSPAPSQGHHRGTKDQN
jgi:integrase